MWYVAPVSSTLHISFSLIEAKKIGTERSLIVDVLPTWLAIELGQVFFYCDGKWYIDISMISFIGRVPALLLIIFVTCKVCPLQLSTYINGVSLPAAIITLEMFSMCL